VAPERKTAKETMISYLTSGNDILGHIAYVLLALSYILTNIFWLRLAAVVSMFFEIAYFYYSGGDLKTGIFWSALFILINAYHLSRLVQDRMTLKLPEKDAPLLREALSGLDDAQINRLLKAAVWKDFAPGDKLTRQDAPLDALYFLLSGRANVVINNKDVAFLEKGSFVGEIAYLTGNPATATVVVDEPSRALEFSRMRMAKVTAGDDQINGIIYQLLGRDLAMKMRRTNTRRVWTDEPTAI
jgi:hypothetical protein